MFVVIFEDGDMRLVDSVDDDLLQEADDYWISLLDVSVPDAPKNYYEGKWHELERYSA